MSPHERFCFLTLSWGVNCCPGHPARERRGFATSVSRKSCTGNFVLGNILGTVVTTLETHLSCQSFVFLFFTNFSDVS